MGSIGGSKQSQSSQSQSEGGSFNIGRQGSSSYGASNVWGAQAPALENLYAQAGALAGGQGAAGMGAQQVANQAQNAWLSQLTPGGNPYFSASVQGAIDQATQGFTRGVLPELDARGVGVGQYGSQRDNLARGEAAGMFGQGLAQQVAGMYANQYEGDQNRALQALGMGGQIQAMQTAPLTTAAGIIGGPTVLNQQGSQSWGETLGQAWNSATSSSSGKGKAANMGIAK